MRDLLYLPHRLPFPPDKGDKVRSYHLFQYLRHHYRVFLGTFIDDAEDQQYIPRVRELCHAAFIAPLDPVMARMRSLAGFFSGEALTLPYYRNASLAAWINRVVKENQIQTAVVFSSAMASYVEKLPELRVLVDFVDVDSAKWSAYARSRPWPLSSIYDREARTLLAHERATAARATQSFFSTDAEATLFRSLAPECAYKIEGVSNGVDAEYYSPKHDLRSPFQPHDKAIVFTGAMDYWPNIDAVRWFAKEVFPELQERQPDLRFYIVGRRPAPAVRALANDKIIVTGTVADTRPYLHHSAVVVAPLRIARGIQNKILEAMAMARPVVASESCAAPIEAAAGKELLTAGDRSQFIGQISELLGSPARAAAVGAAARQLVLERYTWSAHLSRLDAYLDVREPLLAAPAAVSA
jgi:polysaccharide biosynthesis protein PslH